MKIAQLSIANFMMIGEAELRLADRGLCLIQGVNLDDTSADSNGAGKSSIADALCWVLYGTTARGVEGDGVVNRFVGKNCAVTVTVEDGTEAWRITRHRKHKTGKNTLTVFNVSDPGPRDLTKGTDKLTQEVVNQIIGSSYEVFRSSIYAGQENFPDLPNMTDKQLKLLIEEAAGTTVLEKAFELAKASLNEARVTFTHLSAVVERHRADRTALEARLAIAKEKMADNELNRKAEVERLTSEAAIMMMNLKRDRAEVIAADLPAVQAKITECDTKIAAVATELDEERRLAAVLAGKERELAAAKANLEHLKREVEKERHEIVNINHRVGCPCRDCGKPYVDTDIAPARELAQKRLNACAVSFKDKRASAERIVEGQKQALDALHTFRGSMTDLSATNALRASLSAQAAGIQVKSRAVDKLVADIKGIMRQRTAVEAGPNPFEAVVLDALKQIEEADIKIMGGETVRDQAEKDLRLATLVSQVFSPAGVRAHILDTVTPFLNERTSRYLSVLSDGNIRAEWVTLTKTAKGELREKFSIEVDNEHGGTTFAAISGGEKRKVKLAAALALQDLVASRATKLIELFIGDEIDDALDNAGRERLLTILEERARERGSVFIISHSDLKSWISEVLVVTKQGHGSTIEEMTV